jgi:acetyl-CoA synthetase
VILPLFSGYGAGAVAARLADAEAKALFTVDGVLRRGRPVAMKPIADEAAAQAPTIQHVIVARRTGQDVAWRQGRDHWWTIWKARRRPAAVSSVGDRPERCV